MKSFLSVVLSACLIFIAGCSDTPSPTTPADNTAPVFQKTVDNIVPNAYIVVLSTKLQHGDDITMNLLQNSISDLQKLYKFSVTQRYTACLLGFAANMDTETAARMAKDPRIAMLDQDRYVHIDAQTLPTGINRIEADQSTTRSGNGSGTVSGVDIYIIDTGIQTNHPDLNVVGGVSYVTGQTSYNDANGHGTHCAGIAAAKDNTSYVVGVAPGADLYAVRVLDAAGSGQFSWILAGVDWVTARKNANTSRPMVANMSLGGYAGNSSYNSMDQGVANSITAGVTYSIAAGNSSANAINYTPAHVTTALTIGAYAPTNNRWASYSNYGSIVDILAPGSSILSTYRNTSTATLSGTSMAAPHVAGTVALYLSTHPTATPATVRTDLLYDAAHPTKGPNASITRVPSGTTTTSVYAGNY